MQRAYDVGAHDGADTAHYLSMGYRVIAVEANPELCKKLRQRFAAEIADGRLTLLNIAVSDVEGTLPFYVSENDQWSSFDRAAAARNGYKATQIDVPTRRMSNVIEEYGAPDFVKIDIEGADIQCLRGMGDVWPAFLSFEISPDGFDEMLLDLATSRGYTKFSLIQQRPMRPITIPPAGSMAHVQWSARQWLRLELRNHKWIHQALAGTRSRMRWAAGRRAAQQHPSSVPTMIEPTLTPMEHTEGWCSFPEFVWMWRNVIASGMISSTWFDVHARQ